MLRASRIPLRITHLRPGILLAAHRPGFWSPALLVLGMGAWLAMIAGAALGWPWFFGLLLGLLGFAGLLIAPLLAVRADWLSIDLERGWIHWRRRAPNVEQQDSFSPQRIDGLRLRRHGLPGLGWFTLELALDHPRLKRLQLGLFFWPAAARSAAARTAAALGIACLGPHGNPISPLAPLEPKKADFSQQLGPAIPPPEIDLFPTRRGPLVVLPNFATVREGHAIFMFYALVWNVWAWSCLVFESIRFGPSSDWSDEQLLTLGLLLGMGLAGTALMHGAFARLLGRQALRWNRSAWQVTCRWLGMQWGWKPLELRPGCWLRRVDPPSLDAGLWLPTLQGEVQLGHELSPEGLAWLERTMLWPQAEPAAPELAPSH